MKWSYQIFAVLLLIAGMTACSPKMPENEESGAVPQPTLAEPVHALTTRTGIEEIDRILDASADVRKLRSLIQFTSTRCTKLDGLGGPPKCLQGEEEGTPVEVLSFLGPEGSYLRKSEIGNWQGFEVSGIYAIYKVSSNAYSDENNPAGHYAILFVGKENQPAISLRVRDGRIVRVDYVFDVSREWLGSILEREAASFILAPVAP